MIEFYPQMSDRCYTDFHLFQICLTSVDYLFHTDGHGCELTKTITKTKTFTGGRVVSASGRFGERELRECP